MLRVKVKQALLQLIKGAPVVCETFQATVSRAWTPTQLAKLATRATSEKVPTRVFCSYSMQKEVQASNVLDNVLVEEAELSAAEEVLTTVDQLLGEGDTLTAVEVLEAGVARLEGLYGQGCQGLLPVVGQLTLLKFLEGDYDGALEASQRCYSSALTKCGEGSISTVLHAVRYGVMLYAVGDEDAALPLLQQCIAQLDVLVQELTSTVNELPCRIQSEEIEGVMEQLFDGLVAMGEAHFYHSLCCIARSNNGSEVVEQEEAGLLTGLQMLLHSLDPEHLIVGAALREHGRLARRTVDRGQHLMQVQIALQNKRLHEAVRTSTVINMNDYD